MPKTRFRIEEQESGGTYIVLPRGEVDIATAPLLAARLSERREAGAATVLDLSGVSFMDSTGVVVLLRTAEAARDADWQFEIRNPQPAVLRVLEVIGIASLVSLAGHDRRPQDAAANPKPEADSSFAA